MVIAAEPAALDAVERTTLPSHSAASLTRRSLLRSGAGALAAVAGAGALRPARAAPASVPFGAAIQFEMFDIDAAYRHAFRDECAIVLPMNELKFGLLRPSREQFLFEPADRLVDWALSNGQRSRGHTFVWWSTNPDWLEAITDEAEAERVLVDHIERTADHFRGRLESWDVVNEVMAHEPGGRDGPLRDSFWLQRLGPRHIPLAFGTAARADPSARLVINDYDLEFAGDRYDRRRALTLDLVRQLQDAGHRVDAVGIQGHLYSHLKIDREALARFGRDLKVLGVGLLATELDVIDFQVPGGPDEIDEAARVVVSDFLDGLFAGQRPEAVIAWGLTDRYSWVPDAMPRADGSPSRPLPLDRDYRPKPWFADVRQRLTQG
ncbi:endo-1,4-beta-xylanase [Aureimonas sp. AU12]|uniref:endo-1,4-beta-xylanase n=1 Tax=Aureimonas sp. AU12 TaxID=1638161 RepID=UPI0009EA8FEE|nr:endo-1,4-beta-xylanase [Aureimonas sp. AU12]